MNNLYFALVFLAFGGLSLQAQTSPNIQQDVAASTPFQVVERGTNYNVWQNTSYEKNANGLVLSHLHSYKELATGLNFLQNGQWMESLEKIVLQPDGTAAATNGQYQASFPVDIYQGAVQVTTPDGLLLQGQPTALAFDDGTNTVIIAVLTNSIGQIIGDNQVIYTNAFSGINADILYTYKKGSFEQDIVVRQQFATPESFGLSQRARLQVWTEFLNAPEPIQQSSGEDVESGLSDTTLNFGSVTFSHGRAFIMGDEESINQMIPPRNAKVYKSWENVQGHDFLIESVPFQSIVSQLQSLPASASAGIPARSSFYALHETLKDYQFRSQHALGLAKERIKIASTSSVNKSGLVLDYIQISSGETNYTFQGDMTYYISGTCNLAGTTTFEGGTVIKNGASGLLNILASGNVNCATSQFRPAIFTSTNDNSAGEAIGSGTPAFGDVNEFLEINPTNITLQEMRFSYCREGVSQTYTVKPVTANIWDCQFMNVDEAVVGYNIALHNVLIGRMTNEDSAIIMQGPAFSAVNITADGGNSLVKSEYSGSSVVALTNCLVTSQQINTGDAVTFQTNSTFFVASPSTPIYQVVGAGNYYLTNGSPYRSAGTTNISPQELADLANSTTYPPVVFTGTNFTTAQTFSPRVPRDTNSSPDLGYHYAPMDFVFGGCGLNAAMNFEPGTIAGWCTLYGTSYIGGQPYGVCLNDGASFVCSGTVQAPCWVVSYNVVQEGGNANWLARGWMSGLVLNGSLASTQPQINFLFTKSSGIQGINSLWRDNLDYGLVGCTHSEFYNIDLASYLPSMYFTNCLFFRNFIAFWDSANAASFTFQNCTFYNGALAASRTSGQSASFWQVDDTAFDGTAFSWTDNLNGSTNSTYFDYNAYNTNNLSWQTYPYPFPPTSNTLEVVGAQDLYVTNYNWESSWLGNFYLPTNSPLIDAGSTFADELGLFEFTTQTNQIKEGITLVDIGYHYVATDSNGNPLDTYTNGIPDYILDSAGNGIPNWWQIEYYGYVGVNPNAIANGSGLNILQSYQLGLDPTVDASASSGNRANYNYDAGGWLNQVSGIHSGTIGFDSEGNIQNSSQ